MKPSEQKLKEVLGEDAEQQFLAPGRADLIDEHTNYNGGNVSPCTIDRGIYGLVNKRAGHTFRTYSKNFVDLGVMGFTLDELVNGKEHDWANYPKGVIKIFVEEGSKISSGFDLFVSGNVPNGAGLFPSASIEMLIGIVLKDLSHLSVGPIAMALLGKGVKNLFIGVNSSIMDQFAIAMGKKDHAILFDCNTLKCDHVPVVLKDETIVVTNTNKRCGLADSKYNGRHAERDEASAELRTKLPIKTLGELSIEGSETDKDLAKSPIRQKRAKHIIYENQRTLEAQRELSAGNLIESGKLMNQSYTSSCNDYEVTGVELGTLVAPAWEQLGVMDSRMTGADFGGCTVSIAKKDKVGDFIKNVDEAYKDKIGYVADFYTATVSKNV